MKVFIDTYGCAKNEYDSSVLAASLAEKGCSIVNDIGDADILILNTCGFIEDAKKESGYILTKSTVEYKERKQKGEVIDYYWKVTLVKHFTDEKMPERQKVIKYETESAF